MIRNPRIVRSIAVYLLIQFTSSIIVPSVSYALTSGPSQPEFSSFESVATTNMVDEFSGDFTYNLPLLEVPGPHGSGYPISLSYHSGATPEEEASWVGYGWTLNAGAINRGLRGIPDDFNGQTVKFHNKQPKNWTVTAGGGASIETFGSDMIGLNASTSIRYNNNRGFGYNAGVGVSIGKGVVSMGYSVSDGSGSFSLDVNPYKLLSAKKKVTLGSRQRAKPYRQEANAGIRKLHSTSGAQPSYGLFTYTDASMPSIVTPYRGESFNVTIGAEVNPIFVPIGLAGNVFGSYTYQQNTPEESVPAYGYMYSKEGSDNAAALMDYHVEREHDFNKRDSYLGAPFNDADNFIVSGEGIGGGFRLYNKTAGQFAPRHVGSSTDIYNVGAEFGIGWTFGPGADIGKGTHTLNVRDWKRDVSSFQSVSGNTVDEPVFFRFNNDLGGEWGSNHDDAPLQVGMSSNDELVFPASKDKYEESGERSARSSYIGYHRNYEMQESATASTPIAYCRDYRVNSFLKRLDAKYRDLVGEIAVFNQSGTRYVYGLPVYAQNDRTLSYSARGVSEIEHNYLAYANRPNGDIKIGEERLDPYATTYLLTEITTPEYVDRGETSGKWGPTPDDLGGYTYFGYRRTTGSTGTDGDLFTWRTPFNGMLYDRNSHSDPLDDMVSYSEGSKEIYYLHYIETKTHVAFFTATPRVDGVEALRDTFHKNAGAGTRRLEKLDRIDLFLVSDCVRDGDGRLSPPSADKAIKTVVLEYNNALCRNLPNALSGAGKLTLKRVYFQYNGVNKTTISPYDFVYRYPLQSEYTYPARYTSGNDDVTAGYVGMDTTIQNPPYSNFMMDAWGNYQGNGMDRFDNDRPWVDQRPVENYDPAAWQLKIIRLPSGGEIHVQYEQDDYSFVQDQEAHVMAKLKVTPDEENAGPGALSYRYYIDPTSIGLTTREQGIACADMINERYATGKKKIYFKFLYNLIGQEKPDLSTCNAEYITGYASVQGSGYDDNLGIYIDLHRSSAAALPRQVCIDYVKSQRLGKVEPYSSCDPTEGLSATDDPVTLVNQLLNMAKGIAFPESLCKHVNKEYSYFRIPTPLAKKGGGIRVNRLMMYDKGLEGTPVLYGNDYTYKVMNNGRLISSGVATNEPAGSREENILIDFVARKGQTIWQKIVAGEDLSQAEGPLGESVLPAPSVGYSRVIVQNIYSGETGTDYMGNTKPAYQVSEFYTAYDHPVKLAHPDEVGSMSGMDQHTDNPFPMVLPFYTKIKRKTSATQGFRFVVNSMHGQARSVGTYMGTYSEAKDISESTKVSGVQYEYFDTSEPIPVMSSLYGGVRYKSLGREVDVTFAQRSVVEESDDVNVEADLQITIIPLLFVVLVIPYPTAIPSFSNIKGELYTHATSKVVRYPAIVKKVTIVQNGIEHTEENLAFDENTGRSVAVRSTDEFGGAHLAQTIPASWEYTAMAGKWETAGKRLVGPFPFANGYISLGTDPCNLSWFTPGDKIQLGSGSVFYHVVARDYVSNRIQVEKIDKGATFSSSSVDAITIVQSGRANQLLADAGSITMHGERSDDVVPPSIDASNRYDDAQQFAVALRTRTAAITSGKGQFKLWGVFTGMDMSGFSDRITLPSCGDITNSTIRNVQFLYEVQDKELTLQLMRFTVVCGSDSVIVKADGW